MKIIIIPNWYIDIQIYYKSVYPVPENDLKMLKGTHNKLVFRHIRLWSASELECVPARVWLERLHTAQ